MLKIHSFLREMKGTGTPFGIMMLKRRDKIAAPIVYITVAALLVLNFSYFNGFNGKAGELHAKAETIINLLGEVEETQLSDINTTDTQQYTFSNLNLNKNISISEKLEKTEQMTVEVFSHNQIQVFPLGQFSIINSKKALDEVASYIESAAVEQSNLEASTNDGMKQENGTGFENESSLENEKEDLELLSVEASSTATKETKKSTKTTKKSSESKEETETIAGALVLSHNDSMVKKLASEEIEVLQRIVEAEATGEDIYGKILVANVVLNRVNDEEFPDTVKEVVFQKSGGSYQFSPTRDGRYWSVTISDSTIEAVERALSGEDYSQGALYFFARRLTTSTKAKWFDHSLSRLFKYGCHEFYKDK